MCEKPQPLPFPCLVGSMLAAVFPNACKSKQLSGFDGKQGNYAGMWLRCCSRCYVTALYFEGFLLSSPMQTDVYCKLWVLLQRVKLPQQQLFTALLKMCTKHCLLGCDRCRAHKQIRDGWDQWSYERSRDAGASHFWAQCCFFSIASTW